MSVYFDDFDLSDEVLDSLDAMNFVEPSPIQEATIPALLEGRDMLACAQTGTGKTAAYLLPIINRISRGEGISDKVNALVIAPTRELAIQIDQQVQAFSYFTSISSLAIYGGGDGIIFAQQERSLDRGVDIIIATPGRLISMMNLGITDFSDVSYFVLDEADRMLDMGFVDDIRKIHKSLSPKVQTVMYSATMPPKIKTLAKELLHNPIEVELAISKPPEAIIQEACICYDRQKDAILKDFFSQEIPERSIIFSSKKTTVKDLGRTLKKIVPELREMHSDLDQSEREAVMLDFKVGRCKLLIATDIVARGIDVDNVDLVINYEVPKDHEDYVHRIGRTSRGENEGGRAILLVGQAEQDDFARLQAFLGKEMKPYAVKSELGEVPEFTGSAENKKKKRPFKSRQQGNGSRSRGKSKTNKGRYTKNKRKPSPKKEN